MPAAFDPAGEAAARFGSITGLTADDTFIVIRVAGKQYPEIVGYEFGDFPKLGNGEQGTENGETTEEYEDFDDLPF